MALRHTPWPQPLYPEAVPIPCGAPYTLKTGPIPCAAIGGRSTSSCGHHAGEGLLCPDPRVLYLGPYTLRLAQYPEAGPMPCAAAGGGSTSLWQRPIS